jgi:hypothetical protein
MWAMPKPSELAARVERLVQTPRNDLEGAGDTQPGRYRDIVVELNRVLLVEARIQRVAQVRNKVVAEFRAGPADPEIVISRISTAAGRVSRIAEPTRLRRPLHLGRLGDLQSL